MAVVSESLADSTLQGQGFWPRFLFCVPEPRAGSRKLDLHSLQPADDGRLLKFWRRLEELLEIPAAIDEAAGGISAAPVPLSQSAIECWINFYNDCEAKQAPLQEYCHIKAFASRAGELAARLATVFAFFQGHEQVTDSDMKAACSVVRHSLSEWQRFLAAGQPDSNLVAAQEVSDWLVRACQSGKDWQHFSADRWSRCGYKPFRQSHKRNAIFKVLIDRKHLVFDGASKMYSVNPILLEPPDLTDAIEVPNP